MIQLILTSTEVVLIQEALNEYRQKAELPLQPRAVLGALIRKVDAALREVAS